MDIASIMWNAYVDAMEFSYNGSLDIINFAGIRPVFDSINNAIAPDSDFMFNDQGRFDFGWARR
ncbi:hypothetical protein [Corynebacterium glyciniphilum]|uniref:hypothetical protein n=1 Tax=Corynebacterium glyciniphilum TaxID=1404244 RepID=UPI002650F431|nr:hypothetical protein [Corynebacterium glyciniphilum]MDN5684316.1 hypothetical protein [Corynebacterium glyciniphilum]MDN6706503.1 hypothetical protein [Corynebacterium glyciniphilum]